jgi:hypothetical protein
MSVTTLEATYSYSSIFYGHWPKGAGIFSTRTTATAYDSFHQKCSILDTLAAQGLKIHEWE